jgi:hypothetical protein
MALELEPSPPWLCGPAAGAGYRVGDLAGRRRGTAALVALGYSALYTRAQSLFRDLAMARADSSLHNLLARLSLIDVLVIGDWTMAPLSEAERRDWEICEDRDRCARPS